MYQRKLGGGLEDARQLNDTVSPTVAFADRGLSVHCGLSARQTYYAIKNNVITMVKSNNLDIIRPHKIRL